jgi:hypothetical protein
VIVCVGRPDLGVAADRVRSAGPRP